MIREPLIIPRTYKTIEEIKEMCDKGIYKGPPIVENVPLESMFIKGISISADISGKGDK